MKFDSVVLSYISSQSTIHLMPIPMISWVSTSFECKGISTFNLVSSASLWSSAENEVRTVFPCNLIGHAGKWLNTALAYFLRFFYTQNSMTLFHWRAIITTNLSFSSTLIYMIHFLNVISEPGTIWLYMLLKMPN